MAQAKELQEDVWVALKCAPYPMTTRELAGRVMMRRQYLHRILSSWADTGYIIRELMNSTLYFSMRLDASHVRPLLRRDGDVIDREPHMPGWEFRAIREATGMDPHEFSEQFGLTDTPNTVAALESGQRPITKPVAEAVREFWAFHEISRL